MSSTLQVFLLSLLVTVTVAESVGFRYQPLVWPSVRAQGTARRACPCASPDLCRPINKTTKFEVFSFMVTDEYYLKYDWTRISTVVLFLKAKTDKVMCYAHSKGVRVSYGADYPVGELTNAKLRQTWVKRQVAFAKEHFLDGVNLDFEAGIRAGDKARREGLNLLVDELTAAFKAHQSSSQVTFDTPHSTHGGRHFDYHHIGNTMDFILIMAYDESGRCNAGPNCDFRRLITGVKSFQEVGIPVHKMVMGMPWYGYDYPCSEITKDNVCHVSPRCRGRQILYGEIMTSLYPTNTSGRLWDKASVTPFFNRKDSKGVLHQTWYDDKQSLGLKYKWAATAGLRGVGMWDADCLDYSATPGGRQQRADMWGALPVVNKLSAKLYKKSKSAHNDVL